MKRVVYKPLGLLFVGLATLGVFLPLLPTTPFVLLATACFARSSEKWHRWMLQSASFGPMIRNWEQRRCMSLQAKLVALGSMLVAGGASVTLAIQDPLLKLIVVGLMAVGCATVMSINTCDECRGDNSRASAGSPPDAGQESERP